MGDDEESLGAALRREVLVMDGGLSNQLEDQGQDLSDDLWSARLLADDPDQILAAHLAYVRAGARVLITSSYQATFEGFAQRGIDRAKAAELLSRSVELAREAARQAGGTDSPVWVAASIGPYGAMLADGSEYRGRYGLSVRELELFHRPRIEVLAESVPDVLALETVPDIDEAEAMLRAAEGTGVPVWLSYTIDGSTTRAGQPLVEAFALAAGNDQVIAAGVNCCAPEDVAPAVAVAALVTGKPVVVYPNSGERWDAAAQSWTGQSRAGQSRTGQSRTGQSWSGSSTFDPALVQAWRDAGATLIGGCCQVGPAAIAALSAALSA
jgi:homocysteine S-methyltransferase